MELHQQDFRATNVIDWEECFANKTVETYIFLSLISYSLNIYLNYINKTVDDKDPPWMSGWNKNCAIKWKNNAYCKEYVRSRDTLFNSLPKSGYYSQFAFFLRMHIIVIVMVVIS